MSENIGTLYITQIPSLTDSADIQSAFKLYHYGTTSTPTDPVNLIDNSVAGNLRRLDTTAVFIAGTQTITGAKSFSAALSATSTLTVDGTFTTNGNTVIGNNSTDTLTVNATPTFAADTIFNGNLTANGNTIIGTAAGADTLTVNAITNFVGVTTAVTQTAGDSSTKLATTAFTSSEIDGSQIAQWFGDGSDGDVTISSSVSLTRDMYYNNLTIASGGVLATNGYRVHVKGILNVTAAATNSIVHNFVTGKASGGGNGGTGNNPGTAGLATETGPLAGTSGSAGGATGSTGPGNGVSGGNLANSTSVFPNRIWNGVEGKSGTGGTGSPGTGGTNTSPAITFGARRLWIDWTPLVAGRLSTAAGGTGGGSGASASTGLAGAGGGGGAGCYGLAIYANTINRGASTGTGFINMQGGDGGNAGANTGSAGYGGAGAPGQGGFVYIAYSKLTGTSKSAAIKSTGGTGGTAYASASGANGGYSGAVMLINVKTGAISYTAPVAGANGTITAGGAGGVASVTL